MSVLIKGVEMPDSCFHCKLAEVCQHYKAEHYANKRHEDCPLEEVPETHDKRTETHSCDLIDRQAVLKAINNMQKESESVHVYAALRNIEEIVKDLPSAEPETHDKRTETHACDLISRQALCEYALNQKDKSVTPNDIMRFPSADLQLTCNQLATDCICRQAAIDELKKYIAVNRNPNHDARIWEEGMNCAVTVIGALPSAQPEPPKTCNDCPNFNKTMKLIAQPERKTGRWIYGEHDVAMCDGYRCDKCGFFVPWDYQHKFIDFIKEYNFCPNCGALMEG